jgi:hypothetical protein
MLRIGVEGQSWVAQCDELHYWVVGGKENLEFGRKADVGGGPLTGETVPDHVQVARYVNSVRDHDVIDRRQEGVGDVGASSDDGRRAVVLRPHERALTVAVQLARDVAYPKNVQE